MIKILKATKKETPIILEFIKKLAYYENLSHCVVATEKSLEEWLFDKEKAYVLIAYYNNQAIGFALYFYNFSTFLGKCGIYLEDLFVDEKYRNKGIGKAIFKELAKIAKENNFERLDFCCLNNNYPSLEFYKKIGAKKLDEWGMLRFEAKGIDKLLTINEI